MDVAREYRRKLRRESSPIVLLVAIGVGLLVVGLVIVGVVAWRRSSSEVPKAVERTLVIGPAPTLKPTEEHLKEKAVAAAKEVIWQQFRCEVAEEAIAVKYGGDLYVVTGSLQDAGQTKLYETKLRWGKDGWSLEKVFVNGERWYGQTDD